ncbi:MAG TPA: hypothetical protein VGM75_18390 [Pseudonocardiaceae bacterium]
MRALLTGLAGCTAVVLLSGCGTTASSPITAPALPVATLPAATLPALPPKYVPASCPTPGAEPTDGNGVGPYGDTGGGIPAGFQPTWVLACPVQPRNLPGKGWRQVQVTERADLDPNQANTLLGVLRQPSDARRADQICTADGLVLTYYALIDAHGTAIEPPIPMTGCNKPKPGVLKALNGLPYRELSTLPEAPTG